jgi:hypothetical protein
MNEINWSEIWTFLLQMYLPVLFSIIIGAVFKVAKDLLPLIKAKYEQTIGERERKLIEGIFVEAVHAAEQIAKRDDVKNAAEYKLNVARTYADTKLQRYGIKLSATEIYGMLEAQVFSELNKWKEEEKVVAASGVDSTNVVETAPCADCPDANCPLCPVRK